MYSRLVAQSHPSFSIFLKSFDHKASNFLIKPGSFSVKIDKNMFRKNFSRETFHSWCESERRNFIFSLRHLNWSIYWGCFSPTIIAVKSSCPRNVNITFMFNVSGSEPAEDSTEQLVFQDPVQMLVSQWYSNHEWRSVSCRQQWCLWHGQKLRLHGESSSQTGLICCRWFCAIYRRDLDFYLKF